jgi:hypothetical protein
MSQPKSRSGFALMMVMVVLCIGVVLGLTVLSIASSKVASSRNLMNATAARYAAECGLEHAKFMIEDNLNEMVRGDVFGPYSVGGTGVTATYRFWAAPDAYNPGIFTVTAEGQDGRYKRTSQAALYYMPTQMITCTHAMFVKDDTSTPPSLSVEGPMHCDERFVNEARLTGPVTYVKTISGTATITGTWKKVSKIPFPGISWGDYNGYSLGGVSYGYHTRTSTALNSSDALCNGGAVTGSNVGGVVRLVATSGGTVYIGANVKFTGTIISDDDIVLNGSGIELTARPGFPALVSSKHVYVTAATGATINGMVFVDDGIDSWSSTAATRLTINGGLYCRKIGIDLSVLGVCQIKYDPQVADLWLMGHNDPDAVAVVDTWLD